MKDRRCKLRLRTRLELVRRIEAGESQRAAARGWRIAGDGEQVLAALAHSERFGTTLVAVLVPRAPWPKSCP